MVDLISQYQNIKPQIDVAISRILETATFIKGPEVQAFEQELATYLGVSNVISCANGTDALQIAMMALGLKPGDEVITASFTYVATAEVIALLGLTPVLVDVLPDTFNIDPVAIEKAITPKTKAIVPVHLFGQCANMEPILAIAKKYDLFVIEDTAQAIGATYTFSDGRQAKAGTMGTIGATSFFPSKNLGCYGDGGALFTQNDSLAEKIRMIANHGQSIQYYHDVVGVNSRLDAMQAAVLRIKLPLLDTYNQSRQAAANAYDMAFIKHEFIQIPKRASYSNHVFHQYTLQLAPQVDRDKFKAHLASHGIPAMIYYPVALHMQKAYTDSRYPEGHFPITENLCKGVISLPMHSELTQEQLLFIIHHIEAYFA